MVTATPTPPATATRPAPGTRAPERARVWLTVLGTVAAAAGLAVLHALVLANVTTDAVTRMLENEDRRWVGAGVRDEVRERFQDRLFETLRQEEGRAQLGAELLELMRRYAAFRIKVYDAQGTVLWSDDPRLIGRAFPDNHLLRPALAGEVVSKIEPPVRTEHAYERGQAEFVIETYVPIRAADGRVSGVVEVYRRADELVAETARVREVVWLGAGVATAALCASLALIIGLGHRRVLHLHRQVQAANDDLGREKAKLEAVLESVGMGLCLVDGGHRILWANRVLAGWAAAPAGLAGQPCYRTCWGQDAACAGCVSAAALTTGREARMERVHVLEGRERHFQHVAWPVLDAEGGMSHAVELVQDVTDRVELEAQLRHATKLAALGEIAAGVAHEVNNPTGVILATATHLLSQAPAEMKDNLGLIASNAERISRTTSALLGFARRSKVERRPVALNRIVEDTLPLARQRIAQGIELTVELAEGLPAVTAGADDLQVVLLNLVNNACDAMPSGGALRVATRAAGPDRVALEVADGGCGIPPEHMDRIFGPFFSTKAPGKGTGLGLAICQSLVAALGGRISVTSAPGRGSTFFVELPACRESGP